MHQRSFDMAQRWSLKWRRILGGFALAVTLTTSVPASATRCIGPVTESIPIELVEVRQDQQIVEMPDELKGYAQLIGDAESLFFSTADSSKPSKQFRLLEYIAPTPAVDCFISAVRQARTAGRCSMSYDAIVPGKYVFQKEGYGNKVSSGISDPSMVINAQRDRLDLHFDLNGQRFSAQYRLKRSSHHDEFFIACLDEPRSEQPAPVPGHSGCAACSMIGGSEPNEGSAWWLAALLLTSVRRRMRSRCA
jgi:hypothetical protein